MLRDGNDLHIIYPITNFIMMIYIKLQTFNLYIQTSQQSITVAHYYHHFRLSSGATRVLFAQYPNNNVIKPPNTNMNRPSIGK